MLQAAGKNIYIHRGNAVVQGVISFSYKEACD